MTEGYLTREQVASMQVRRMQLRVTYQTLADHVGISRCYINLMLNHKHPFLRKYQAPVIEYLRTREKT